MLDYVDDDDAPKDVKTKLFWKIQLLFDLFKFQQEVQ
jgi:hypothetical protein